VWLDWGARGFGGCFMLGLAGWLFRGREDLLGWFGL